MKGERYPSEVWGQLINPDVSGRSSTEKGQTVVDRASESRRPASSLGLEEAV